MLVLTIWEVGDCEVAGAEARDGDHAGVDRLRELVVGHPQPDCVVVRRGLEVAVPRRQRAVLVHRAGVAWRVHPVLVAVRILCID